MARKQTFKGAKRRADIAMSKYIRHRDGKCVICGSRTNLNNGHYLSRVATSTRFDDQNCNCQCASCNKKHEQNTIPYTKFMIKKYGEGILDHLNKKYNETKKYTIQELLDLEEYYNGLLNE